MKISGEPKKHKRIYVTQAQIEQAAKDFQSAVPGQSGWYCFDLYCTREEMMLLELMATTDRLERSESELARLRDAVSCIKDVL